MRGPDDERTRRERGNGEEEEREWGREKWKRGSMLVVVGEFGGVWVSFGSLLASLVRVLHGYLGYSKIAARDHRTRQ